MFLECRKGHLGGRKAQMVNLGSKTPTQPKVPAKQQKNDTTTIGLIRPKMTKTGERTPKGQMVPFSLGHAEGTPPKTGGRGGGVLLVSPQCGVDTATQSGVLLPGQSFLRSAAEWLRARLRPPWSLQCCDAIAVLLRPRRGQACCWRTWADPALCLLLVLLKLPLAISPNEPSC